MPLHKHPRHGRKDTSSCFLRGLELERELVEETKFPKVWATIVKFLCEVTVTLWELSSKKELGQIM